MFQIFDEMVFIQFQKCLSVNELGEIFPDESVNLIKQSSGAEHCSNVTDIKISLQNMNNFSSGNISKSFSLSLTLFICHRYQGRPAKRNCCILGLGAVHSKPVHSKPWSKFSFLTFLMPNS